MTLETLERRDLPSFTSLALDHGPVGAPIQPGFIRMALTAYSASAGFGWESPAGINMLDRGAPTALRRDFAQGKDETLIVDVVNGVYKVNLYFGDALSARSAVRIFAEGANFGSTSPTAAGQFTTKTINVTVNDGQLNLNLVAQGNKSNTFALDGVKLVANLLVNAGPDLSVSEGQTCQFSGSTSALAPYTVAWDFGDGGTASGTLQPTKAFADQGFYSAILCVTTSMGIQYRDLALVSVSNVAPTATFANGGSVVLGNTGSVWFTNPFDPSSADTAAGFKYSYDFDNDGVWDLVDADFTSATVPAANLTTLGGHTVAGLIKDKDGGSTSYTTTVQVVASAPTAILTDGGAVNEGSAGAISFSNAAGGTGGYSYSYDFDNNGTFEIANSTSATATVPASYLDDGPGSRVVHGRITDSAASFSDYTTTISINNVAPTASISGPSSTSAGTAATFTASATDPSVADTNAGFSFTWDFGDGSTAAGTSVSHTYAAVGTYTITLTADDKDGGQGVHSSTVYVTDNSDPLNKPVLNHADFTYLGAFNLPTMDGGLDPTSYGNGWSTAYSKGGLTLRYVDGQLRFLSTSHIYGGGQVFEFNYPGLGTTGNLPQAGVVRNWGDVYDGHKWVGNNGGTSSLGSESWTYGLYYDSNLQRLYWNYGDWYNASNPYNPSFGYSVLDEATGVATGIGAWSLADRPEKFSRGGTTRIPQWFADRFTGGKTLGVGFGGYFSIISSGCVGPSLAAVSDPEIGASPDRSALANVPMIGYPYNIVPNSSPERGHRDTDYHNEYETGWDPSGGNGFWTWSDNIFGSGVWIDLPDRQGVLFIAKVGQGRNWYENSTTHAERGAFEWYVYDPADLAAVATGAKQQWQIQAKYSWIDSNLPLGIVDQSGWEGEGGSNVGGVSFDPATNRLYVLVTGVWKGDVEYYSRIYAYQLGSVTPQVVSVTPLAGATNVNTATAVTITFDRAMDSSTVNTATIFLADINGNVVGATVTYDPITRTATLTPTVSLSANTTYRATVRGGVAGPSVKDILGDPLAADLLWSFTTAL